MRTRWNAVLLILKGLVGRQFSQMIDTLIIPRGKNKLVHKGMKAPTYLFLVPRGKTKLVRKGMKAATYLFLVLFLGCNFVTSDRQLLLSPDPLGVFTSEN